MSRAPLHPCPRPHCGTLTARTWCRRHEREQWQARESSTARGYGGEWTEYSRNWLRRFPWCGQRQDGKFYKQHSRCTQFGQRVRATVTDHIHPIRDGGARLDPANHQSLCTSCNNRKR
jgi:5-methylcytosine-specific restriction protein A